MSFFILTHLALGLLYTNVSMEIIKVPEEYTPGKHHIIVLEIHNNEKEKIYPKINLTLPDQWYFIIKPANPMIESGKSKRLFYTLALPSKIKAGTDTLKIELEIENVVIEKKVFPVKIKEQHKINIEIYEEPTYLVEDTDFTCTYEVTNTGNTNEKIQLHSNHGVILEETVMIPSDSSIYVTVAQKTPVLNLQKQQITNHLSVLLVKPNIRYDKNIPLIVFPNKTKQKNLYQKFPISIGLSYNLLDQITEQVLRYELKGSGFIDKEKRHRLEILKTGTNRPNINKFQNLNRNSIKYEYKDHKFSVGNINVRLSELLRSNTLKQGFYYKIKNNKYEIQSFYGVPDHPEIEYKIGGTINYQINDSLNFGVENIHNHYINNQNSFSSNLSGTYKTEEKYITGNYAMSVRDNNIGIGCSLIGMVKQENFNLRNKFLYVNENFEGYYYNTLFYSSQINYTLSNTTSIENIVHHRSINRTVTDTLFTQTAPFSETYKVGFKYSNAKTNKASQKKRNLSNTHKVYVQIKSAIDRSENEQFNYTEKSVEYQHQLKLKNLQLQFRGVLSDTYNQIADIGNEDQTSIDLSLLGDYKISNSFKINGAVTHTQTNRYTSISKKYLFYQGSISYQSKKIQLNTSYSKNSIEEFYKQQKRSFSFNLNYLIAKNQSLSISSRYVEKDPYLTFKYKTRLGMPIPFSKDPNLGNIKGRIYFEDHSPVKEAMISIGHLSTMTNSKGNYKIKTIPTGTYYLTVNLFDLGKEYISMVKTPLKIEITKKETKLIDIPIVKAANIKGKINFKKTEQSSYKEIQSELPVLIIALKNEEDTLYTKTRMDKTFYFNQLLPGEYTVSIENKGLNRKFNIPQASKNVSLKSGDHINIEFEITTKLKKMKFQPKVFDLTTSETTTPSDKTDQTIVPTDKEYHLIAGSFSNHKNAVKLVSKLEKQGFPSYTIDKNSNGFYRVVLKSFSDKEEALRDMNSINTSNKFTWLLEQKIPASKEKYHLIAGSFSDYKNAEKLVSILQKQGFPSYLIDKSSNGFYRVILKSFSNKEEALQQMNNINTLNRFSWLLKHKNTSP